MAKEPLVTIASFENSVAAHAAIALLERHNIEAWMLNATVADALWQLNIATGGVKLQVQETDAERALSVLEESGSKDSDQRGTWLCGKCQESVEGQFEVCWSCGGLREDVEDASATVVAEASNSYNFRDSLAGKRDESALEPSNNPYHSPRPLVAHNDDELNEAAEEEAAVVRMKSEIQRAYYAAIFGLGICPFWLHLFSLVILLSACFDARFDRRQAEPKTKRQFCIALIIDLATISIFIYVAFHL